MLTRFRLSNHVLEIEKGRHCKPKLPVEERICRICNNNTIEDEYHFICVCPAYQTLRQEYIDEGGYGYFRISGYWPKLFLDTGYLKYYFWIFGY